MRYRECWANWRKVHGLQEPLERLRYVLVLAGFALSIWGFGEIGCLRGNAGPNKYGSNPLSAHAARG